jgi:transposase
MEGMKMSRARVPHRVYTAEFKMEAVRLAREVGVSEAARRLDMPMTSIQNWMKLGQLVAQEHTGGKKVTQEQAELSRLCRVLRVSRTGYLQWRVRAPSAR